ncbi:MAG: acyltransferase family protein [Alphaproteobacteria bacterium]
MSPSISKRPRLYMLDGLRGLCAILVMVYHYLSWNKIEFFQVGTFGVYIFFILSGFSIWHVYGHTYVTRQSLRAFYVARFARIFPLYFLVSLWSYYEFTTLKTFLLNATFLFGLAAPGLTSGITGGWSIGIEWVFYLVFPLFWIFLPNLKMMFALLAASILINQIYVGSLFRQADLGTVWFDYTNFPVFLVYFIAGMLCAMLYGIISRKHPQGFSIPQEWLFGVAIVATLLFVFAYPSSSVENYLWGYHFTLLILASSLAILLCACIDKLHPIVIKLCKFLGDISFSAYLIHYYMYEYGMRFFTNYFSSIRLEYTLAIIACLTLCVAYLLNRLYEIPARNLINSKYAKRVVS